MIASIFILFCFSLKQIFTNDLNETNFFYQLPNTEESRLQKCLEEVISKENKTESLICILEEFRDNPDNATTLIKNTLSIRQLFLPSLLYSAGMECLYDLVNEILDPEHKFINDLFDVIKNKKEFFNYIIYLYLNK